MQSNSLIKSTLMFNVLQGTEIIVHAQFTHCRQNWYYGWQVVYSSISLKSGGFVHTWTPTLPESRGSGPQDSTGSPPLTTLHVLWGAFSSTTFHPLLKVFCALLLLAGQQEEHPVCNNCFKTPWWLM